MSDQLTPHEVVPDILAPASTKQRLEEAWAHGRQSHGVLYQGAVGCAALPLALTFIQRMHCEKQSACGQCHACYLSLRMIHPDTHFFFPQARSEHSSEALRAACNQAFRTFATEHPYGTPTDWHVFLMEDKSIKETANKQLSIGRAEIKELLDTATHTAYQSQYKAIVIWAAEHMQAVAVNTLLKTLESPPYGTYFFFISYDAAGLLPTLRSRLQAYTIPYASQQDIANYVAHKGHVETSTAHHYVGLSGFQPELALAWCKEGVVVDQEFLKQWLRSCWRGAQSEWFGLAQRFNQKSKLEQKLLLMSMLRFFREALLHKSSANELCNIQGDEKLFVEKFTAPISFVSLKQLAESVHTMLHQHAGAAHAKMLFLRHTLDVADTLYEDKLRWQSHA